MRREPEIVLTAPAAPTGRLRLTNPTWRPRAVHRRILDATLELVSRTGWPTQTQVSTALKVTRQAVSKHFRNPDFVRWYQAELDAFTRDARSAMRAKFAHLATQGSIDHFKALGWGDSR